MNQSNYETMLNDFDKAISRNPNDVIAHYNRGVIHQELGHYEEALNNYNRAISLDPNYANAYNNRGTIYYSMKRNEEALSNFNKAISVNPNYIDAHCNRGLMYRKSGRYNEALNDYSRIISISPNYTKAYYDRGEVYYDLERYEEALSDYTKAISLKLHDADIYYDRGITYQCLGRYEEALIDFEKAISLDPNYAHAYFGMGVILAQQEKDTEAISYLDKAEQLGDEQLKQGIARSRQMLEALASADPDSPLDQAFDALGQVVTKTALQQAVQQHPILLQDWFVSSLEDVIAQQEPLKRKAWQERLELLKQLISQTQNNIRTGLPEFTDSQSENSGNPVLTNQNDPTKTPLHPRRQNSRTLPRTRRKNGRHGRSIPVP
ncbi:tetratricopeptide repeat protein [Anaerolineales bacterium HSG25]|nr:tetratricopeptide repeat protein [Anaerolineales bacterium HSG25]